MIKSVLESENIQYKRTEFSKCLLCNVENSIKKNSHIIPKFLTKTILGNDNIKSGYNLSSNHINYKKQQDSPKENYILCNNCEKYFSVLETYISNKLNKIKNKKRFIEKIESSDLLNCNNTNPLIFRLLIYSIIWRCHISSILMFKNFNLNKEEFDSLHNILLTHRYKKYEDIKNDYNQNQLFFKNHSIYIISAVNFEDDTKNILFIHPFRKNPYFFFINRFIIIVSFNKNNFVDELKKTIINKDDYKVQIFFSNILFYSLKSTMLNIVANNNNDVT